MRSYESINDFVFSLFYRNMICFTAMFQLITAEATSSRWLPIFVNTAIGLVIISRERFEHELTWLASETITRGPTLSEKDRHFCMRDERIGRDTCQSFLPKTPNSLSSEQCRILVPSFRCLRMERLGPWPPLLAMKTVPFSDSDFPYTEARVISVLSYHRCLQFMRILWRRRRHKTNQYKERA